MGFWDALSSIFSSDNVNKAGRTFSGKNKKAISDGLRKGSSECGKIMREWGKKKKK